MSRKRDAILPALLLRDNLITLQLFLMAPAFAATAVQTRGVLTALFAGLILVYGAVFYLFSPRLPRGFFFSVKYFPQPLLIFTCALFFLPFGRALYCAAELLFAELILFTINDRLAFSGVRPGLQLPAALISAVLLCAAFMGLRL